MIADLQTVFQAEFMRRIRSRPFIIGLLIGVAGIMLFTKLPAFIGSAFTGSTNVIVVGEPAVTNRVVPLLQKDYHVKAQLKPQAVTAQTLTSYDAGSAIVAASSPQGLKVTVVARDPGSVGAEKIRRTLLPLQLAMTTGKSPDQVKTLTNFPVDVKPVASKFTSSDEADMVRGIAYTLIFFLYVLILVNSQLVTSSVAEEKTSRIAELLVASVDPVALLSGKVLAGGALAVIQMFVWIAAGMVSGQSLSSHAAAQAADVNTIFSLSNMLDVLTPGVIVAFFLFFIIGFLQLSTLFAALASLINRTEDLGAITGPLTIPVIGALFVAIGALGSPDASWAVITSFIPIVSPFVMFARIAVSFVPFWQIALSLAINLVALGLIAVFAGKIYRVGMLMYGRAPKLSQVWSVLRS